MPCRFRVKFKVWQCPGEPATGRERTGELNV
jgi:hypothetical protein